MPRKNLHDLSRSLDISVDDLRRLSECVQPYGCRIRQRPSGKPRLIRPPSMELKAVQSRIHKKLLRTLRYPSYLHGYVPGRSFLTNARAHKLSKYFVCFDLQDFFPSIGYKRVASTFSKMGWSGHALVVLTRLTTHRGSLPQGAPTSALLANLAAGDLDDRLLQFCATNDLVYTRYSDDLTFSSQVPTDTVIPWIDSIIRASGFTANAAKTKLFGPQAAALITGLEVFQGTVRVPRAYIERTESAISAFRSRCAQMVPKIASKAKARILGRLAYIRQIDTLEGRRLWELLDGSPQL